MFSSVESCRTKRGVKLTAGVVDYVNQIQLLAASFQPVVLADVLLHQFSQGAAPRQPLVHRFHLLPAYSPQRRPDHDLPQRFPTDPQLVLFCQVLAGQRRPEACIHVPGTEIRIACSRTSAPSFRFDGRPRSP